MSPAVTRFLADLAAYSLQLGVVLTAGLVLARACQLRTPRVRLTWGQALLVLALLLPLVQAGQPAPPTGGLVRVLASDWTADSRPGQDWTTAASFVLAAGLLARLGLLGWRLARLRGYRRESRPLPACPALAQARALVGGSATVYVCPPIEVPATFGVFRPLVLVPAHFSTLDEQAQVAVLCHEMRHVRRHDWLQTLVEELVRAALWFHPVVWWAVREMRVAREQVVDQEVVRLTGRRQLYLETLVQMARRAARARPAPAALFLSESRLKGRVESLLREVTMSRRTMWRGVAAGLGGVALAAAISGRAFPLQGAAPAQARVVRMEVSTSDGAVTGQPAAKKRRERAVVHTVQPTYPPEARTKGIEGIVQLDVLITAAGDVEDVRAMKGPSELREAAAQAVRQWKYAPADQDARATITVWFSLDEKDGATTSGRPAAGPRASADKPAERTLVHKVQPIYPPEAKSKGIDGIVQLDVLITAAGDVTDVKVIKGRSELTDAAAQAVKQWKYERGPQDTRATLTINYRLDKKEDARP